MAKFQSTLIEDVSGKLNNVVMRQTVHGPVLAKAPRKAKNARRSEKQANLRCQMANAAANFKLYEGKLKEAFEGKATGLSEYNCFIQINYNKEPVFITRQMRIQGACVLAECHLSNGSLPTIDAQVSDGGVLVSDLALGSLVIGAETTKADLSLAILQNNDSWKDGDQLTFFYGVQKVDSQGVPRAQMKSERVVLDTLSEEKLLETVTELGFTSVQVSGAMYLGMSTALVNAGATWVHSRENQSGNIKVSPQRLVVVSDILAQYQTQAAMKASAESYGGINQKAVYLDPGTTLAEIGGGLTGSGIGTVTPSTGGNTGSVTPSGGGNTGGNTGGGETTTVAAPTISGDVTFDDTGTVDISAESGAEIHYTLDGSTPTSASATYSGSITLTDTTTVKAVAVKNGVTSAVASMTFTKSAGGDTPGGDPGDVN